MNEIILVKDLTNKNGLPSTPYQLVNNIKPNIKHFRVFGCPGIFKRYEISEGDGNKIFITKAEYTYQKLFNDYSELEHEQ